MAARQAFQVSAAQFSCTGDFEENLASATATIETAAQAGSHLLLIQELFASLYFCQQEAPSQFATAAPASLSENPLLQRMSQLAKQHRMVLPISFFERCGNVYFNSLVVFDADGAVLGGDGPEDCLGGVYRKVHIPTGPGYQEKYYFSPAPPPSPANPTAGFRVFHSRVFNVTIGVGICWDQWFPETARCLALLGAEVLLFPTAIGSEPQDPSIHSRDHWQRAMCGHAAANLTPVVASNRIGRENEIRFYGSSFICDATGKKLAEADEDTRQVLSQQFDLDALRAQRASWGLFRDRRPEVYGALTTLHGRYGLAVGAPRCQFRMPGEWAPHERCWMIWLPNGSDVWHADSVKAAQMEFAAVANAISQWEPVSMLAAPENVEEARALLGSGVTVVPVAHDDCWARDTLPTFVVDIGTGDVGGVDWVFNGYSNKFPHQQDAQLARIVLAMAGKRRFGSPLILEGGSIHVDGEGTLLTTAECLLKRNPTLTKEDIELQLQLFLGISKVIWVPEGVVHDDDTDGHVDNMCCFARPGEVVLTFPSDASHIQRARSEAALKVLQASEDAQGRRLKVHLLEHPKLVYVKPEEVVPGLRSVEQPLAASYINYYMANGAIIMPAFEGGEGHDVVAQKQLQAIYPKRTVVTVSTRLVLCGGGNIHCITQQQPAGLPL